MKKVLVTGANGHLGYSLVKLLKERGYDVTAAVRNANDSGKTKQLQKLGVKLVSAELSDRESLRKALAGQDGLFQVAAAFNLTAKDPQKEVLEPNIQGTRNVMEEAHNAGIKKIVYTSSIAAVGTIAEGEAPLNESSWNDSAKEPYAISKTLSEKLAWELAEQLGLNLVTILPGTIVGPQFAQPTSSLKLIQDILKGQLPFAPKMTFSYVDVRDVAMAHLQAYENPQAKGRYIATGETLSVSQVCKLVKEIHPKAKTTGKELPSFVVRAMPYLDAIKHALTGLDRQINSAIVQDYLQRRQEYNSDRLTKEFQWKPMPIKKSLQETVDWMLSSSV
ncbi:NAD-dependent epimerase/dehydratase family protein [Leptospira langatensis]|uniref:NAD-dependent epimerase/dehydratase family protein n=1 Tax=Leptospira langatensis TaxID=2484983 RepID=A0A5F1ZN89_9LEPT|nr:NAD-dependent epimerase/dehydratase family protein [Leptospira langatensis]TGK05172.1 NAD-dependent epimerase/dehydratase family protein [Leptospira langatensis]TGL38308.1 NAD-dependent epimerase/dehydratase family protein [Leptospira langatensis]